MVDFYVGSQYGNSQGVAEELKGLLIDENDSLDVSIYDLNDLIEHDHNKKIVIICSTTGDGDVPENAVNFWMKVKKRTLSKDRFNGLKYLILGLGDTNYSNFCGASKKITKRLKELSAVELNPLITMDDETNDYEDKLVIFHKLIIDFVLNKN